MTPYRNRALLNLAKGMPCQFRIQGICNGNPETTVACHANWQQFGKGKGIKASDWAMAHGCAACHTWLDSSDAPDEEKLRTFLPAALKSYTALIELGRLINNGCALSSTEYASLYGSYRPAATEDVDNLVFELGNVAFMLATGRLSVANTSRY